MERQWRVQVPVFDLGRGGRVPSRSRVWIHLNVATEPARVEADPAEIGDLAQ